MLYLVEAHASMERGNKIDGEKGPGPIFAKIVERFRPEAFYGNPSRRQIFLVVDLDTPAKMAELMYVPDVVCRHRADGDSSDASRGVRRGHREREADRNATGIVG